MLKIFNLILTAALAQSADKYTTIYDSHEPIGTDQRAAKKGNSLSDRKGPLLSCGSNKISIVFDHSEFRGSDLTLREPEQIFFRDHEHCFAQKEGKKYILNLFFPFTDCGTNVVHDTEDYVYTNQVIFKTKDGVDLTLLQFRCVYEDNYIVSYETGLKPVERTISFHTEMGTFDVDMETFDGPEFEPSQKLNDHGGVYLNERLYVQLEMYDPMRRNEIVLSLQTCYATDSPELSQMDLFHRLISSMCAIDETVQIHSNGISDKARFSFNMFRFKESFSYIYLHCEVRICNSTSEHCQGHGKMCNGAEPEVDRKRVKRNAGIIGDIPPNTANTQKFISRGPILVYARDDMGQGEYTVNSLLLEVDNISPFGISKLFVFGTVASGLVFGVVVGLTLIVCKHKQKADERSKEFEAYNQAPPMRTIYGDLMFSCRPPADINKRIPRCMPNHFI